MRPAPMQDGMAGRLQRSGRGHQWAHKSERLHRRARWKTRQAVGFVTLEWVERFDHHRPFEPIGYIPPAQAEANYYRQLASQATTAEA